MDDSSSAAATGSITVTVSGTTGAAATGVLRLMIAGQSVPVTVVKGDSVTEIAKSIADKIASRLNLPVTATAALGVVTLTAKNKGLGGNYIDVRFNHDKTEKFPAGVGATVVAMANGGADPSYEDSKVASVIAGVWYNAIVIGSDDSENVDYIRSILADRWTATVQQTGVLYFSTAGDLSDFTSLGEKLNTQLITVPAIVNSPTPPCEIAAAVLGAIAPIAINDPAVPLANWPVAGIVAPKPEDDLNLLSEKNALLRAGIALLGAGDDGTVYLRRMVTTYKRNAAGASDTSYQQLEKVHTLSNLRWDWNAYLGGKYPHSKLADDGNEFGPGQTIMTPSLGKAEILSRYQYWLSKGLVQNYDVFAENVIVQRDVDDQTALCFLVPADLIDQLLITKTKMQFN